MPVCFVGFPHKRHTVDTLTQAQLHTNTRYTPANTHTHTQTHTHIQRVHNTLTQAQLHDGQEDVPHDDVDGLMLLRVGHLGVQLVWWERNKGGNRAESLVGKRLPSKQHSQDKPRPLIYMSTWRKPQ